MPILLTLCLAFCMLFFFGLLYLFVMYVFYLMDKDIKEKNYIIDIIAIISFVIVPSVISILFGYPKFAYYIVTYGVMGTLIEFTIGWTYYQLFGARLYRYYKQELFGFSSIRMFPLWAAAGIYFFFVYNVLTNLPLNLANSGFFTIILFAGGFAGILISLIIASVFDLMDKKLDTEKGYSLGKYFIFSSLFIAGPIAISIHYGFGLFVYYLIAMITGVFLEGLLGLALRKIYGESFWRYYRWDIFSGQTSYKIAPLWLGAISMALIFMYLFL